MYFCLIFLLLYLVVVFTGYFFMRSTAVLPVLPKYLWLRPWFTLITFYWTMYCTVHAYYIVRKCVVNTSLLRLFHGFTQYLHGKKLIFCSFVGGWPHDLTWLDWRFSKNLTLATVKATGLFCKSFIKIRILTK